MTKKKINEADNPNEDEKSELLDKFNLIEKIAKMLTNHGYKKIISSLIIFILIITTTIIFTNQKTIIERIVKEQKHEQQKEEHTKLNFRINHVNPRVDGILYKSLVQTKADRAFVIEMHNGINNPTGLPFVFGSMTYEKLSNENVESLLFQYENFNLSSIPLTQYLIKHNKFIGTIDELNKVDRKIGGRMKVSGVEFIVIYGLRTMNVEIGWVGVTYGDSASVSNIDIQKVESNMIETSQNLSILLDINNNISEKK